MVESSSPICAQTNERQGEVLKIQAIIYDSSVRKPGHTHTQNRCMNVLIGASTKPRDIVIYTDGWATIDQSGWGYTAKQGGRTKHKNSFVSKITYQVCPWG